MGEDGAAQARRHRAGGHRVGGEEEDAIAHRQEQIGQR
jgi:hypothetical protein